MTRISSKRTVWYKRGLPILWFGFLAVFFAAGLLSGGFEKDVMFLIVPCIMAMFGYFMIKKLVWDLVDEVYVDQNSLLIKNRGEEDHVALSNVMNVSATMLVNPPRVTLRLVKPCKFGDEITFTPATAFTLNPFAKNQVTEDLIVSVHNARLLAARPN
jgi:hypothetical protein